MGLTIENIPATRRREVATLLSAAFLADEHFARFFPEPNKLLAQHVAEMFAQGCESYETSRATFLAATRGGRMVGATVLFDPRRYTVMPWVFRLWYRWRRKRWEGRVGQRASALLRAYANTHRWLEPPFHYVGYLGVLPEEQRAGVGRRMLDNVYGLACEDPNSRGVLLHTVNVRLAACLERTGWTVDVEPLEAGSIAHACFRACAPMSPQHTVARRPSDLPRL